MGLSEQEGQEPKAQGEEVPQVGVWANQEGCRAACGVQTGGQADMVVSTGQLLCRLLFSMIHVGSKSSARGGEQHT